MCPPIYNVRFMSRPSPRIATPATCARARIAGFAATAAVVTAATRAAAAALAAVALAALGSAAAAPATVPPGTDAGSLAPPPEIAVYAAASLKEALTTLAPACEAHAGVRLVHNFGATNDLARQIVAANKADLFFSADESWMDKVAQAGLIEEGSRQALLSNRLAVVVPGDSTLVIRSAADLAGAAVRRLSLANPEAVPAGRYAKAWLEGAGVWAQVSGRVVPAPDVRAALAAVEAGAVEAGVVYTTDAAIARRARVAYVVPESEGPRIVYPIAALQGRPHPVLARRGAEWHAGPYAHAVFERFGFLVIGTSPAPPRGR